MVAVKQQSCMIPRLTRWIQFNMWQCKTNKENIICRFLLSFCSKAILYVCWADHHPSTPMQDRMLAPGPSTIRATWRSIAGPGPGFCSTPAITNNKVITTSSLTYCLVMFTAKVVPGTIFFSICWTLSCNENKCLDYRIIRKLFVSLSVIIMLDFPGRSIFQNVKCILIL